MGSGEGVNRKRVEQGGGGGGDGGDAAVINLVIQALYHHPGRRGGRGMKREGSERGRGEASSLGSGGSRFQTPTLIFFGLCCHGMW